MAAKKQPVPGLFITGTGTGVGKTHVAAMIARSLVASGHRVGVYKPVASGCYMGEEGKIVADDAVQLWEAASRPENLDLVCPQKFLAPLAPHRAAAEEGRRVDSKLLRDGFEHWRSTCDVVLVEGAGGLLSPISDEDDNAKLAADLGLPLLIVATNELGTINATRQTVLAARVLMPQLPIAGIVLNQTEPREEDNSLQSNQEEIALWCNVPILASIEFEGMALAEDAVVGWFKRDSAHADPSKPREL